MTSEICKKHNVDHTGTICGACYNELLVKVKQLEAKREIFEKKAKRKVVYVVNDGGTVFKIYKGQCFTTGDYLMFDTLEQAKKISFFIIESRMIVERISSEIDQQEKMEYCQDRINNFTFRDYTKF